MQKQIVLYMLLTAAFSMVPWVADAATIAMRDRSSIPCEISRETPATFEIKRLGVEYNIVHRHDTVQKADIFAVIDDTGRVIFPDDLTLKITPGMEEALTEAMFQRKILDMQIAADERVADRLGSIRTVLWVQFVIALTAGVLVAAGD